MAKNRRQGALQVEKIREMFRLKSLGFSNRDIALSVKASASTVADYIGLLTERGVAIEEALKLDYPSFELLFKKRRAACTLNQRLDFQKISKELTRTGVTLELLHQESCGMNEPLSYSHYCALYAKWAKKNRKWTHQVHKAGEKVFVDYSGTKPKYWDSYQGQWVEVELYVAVLGASSLLYAEASQSQSLEHWIGSTRRLFEFLGGVPKFTVPDNLKSGVTKACRYDPIINKVFAEMGAHYSVGIMPARANAPKDKAKVERGVQLAQRWILAKIRNQKFGSLSELNLRIKELVVEFNTTKKLRLYGMTRKVLFDSIEKEQLKPLPEYPYEYGFWKTARVHPDSHVQFENHFYSVPCTYLGEKVEIRATERQLEMYFKEQLVARHIRCTKKGAYSTVASHLPTNQQAYLEATSVDKVLSWAASKGKAVEQQAQAIVASKLYPEQGLRPVLGLVRLAEKKTASVVNAACHYANERGLVGYHRIKNIVESNMMILPPTASPPTPSEPHELIRGADYYGEELN
jgi:transposase